MQTGTMRAWTALRPRWQLLNARRDLGLRCMASKPKPKKEESASDVARVGVGAPRLLPADWCDPKAPGGLENQCSVLTPCHYVSACSSTDIYSNTVNLPKTSFDMRANSTVREPQLQAFWQEHRVYETLSRENPGVGCRGVCGGSCVTGWCAGRLGL